jgi:hypothetical protein
MDIDHQIHEMAGRKEFFRRAMTALWNNTITGDYAEFGCYGAVTFRLAWQESRKWGYAPKLWAFDSFQGLPQSSGDHPRWVPGGMAMDEAAFVATLDWARVPRDAYAVVPGFYSETLTAKNPGAGAYCPDICLAYIDCDLYDSTRDVLRFLQPRLKHGMILAFDDYNCWWPEGVAGERRAFLEMAAEVDPRFNFVPFMAFGWHGQAFVVESRALLKGLRPRGHL